MTNNDQPLSADASLPVASTSVPPTPRARLAKLALQLLTFLLGVALLAYAGSIAFSKDNQVHLAKLQDAPLSSLAALVGLSLASLLINGLVFWITIRPVQSVRGPGVVATNALAAFLAYAPFKLGLLLRIAIHTRRDRVPLARVGAWFASVAITILATLGTLASVCIIHRTLDVTWVALAIGALLLVGTTIVLCSRFFAGERGLDRFGSLLRPISARMATALLGSDRFRQLHSATAMLASPTHVALSMGLRVLDIALQAARVPIAAGILGLSLPYTDAFLIACSSFLIGIVSPTGPVGSREVTVIKVCELLAIPEAQSFAIVALVVSAAEAAAYAVGAIVALICLGPTRLFTPREPLRLAPEHSSQTRL